MANNTLPGPSKFKTPPPRRNSSSSEASSGSEAGGPLRRLKKVETIDRNIRDYTIRDKCVEGYFARVFKVVASKDFDPDPPKEEVRATNLDPNARARRRHRVRTGDVMALKVLHKDINKKHHGQEKHEVKTCRALLEEKIEHENLIKFYGFFYEENTDVGPGNPYDKRSVALLLEYANRGSLDLYRAREETPPFTLGRVKYIIREVLKGISHLHEHDWVHTNIKLGNILIHENDDRSLQVKLGGFGNLRRLKKDKNNKYGRFTGNSCGSILYNAPEVHEVQYDETGVKLGVGRWGKEVDIYSAGVVLYTLIMGNYPFIKEIHEMQERQEKNKPRGANRQPSNTEVEESGAIRKMIIELILEGRLYWSLDAMDLPLYGTDKKRKKINAQAAHEIRNFLKLLLNPVPRKRKIAKDLVDHSFLTNIVDDIELPRANVEGQRKTQSFLRVSYRDAFQEMKRVASSASVSSGKSKSDYSIPNTPLPLSGTAAPLDNDSSIKNTVESQDLQRKMYQRHQSDDKGTIPNTKRFFLGDEEFNNPDPPPSATASGSGFISTPPSPSTAKSPITPKTSEKKKRPPAHGALKSFQNIREKQEQTKKEGEGGSSGTTGESVKKKK